MSGYASSRKGLRKRRDGLRGTATVGTYSMAIKRLGCGIQEATNRYSNRISFVP
jgi:hypothetical protein